MMCVVAAGGACCALFSLSSRVCACCRVQRGGLPLRYAAQYSESEAVIKALLDAYPDAIKEKDKVRCGRGRRVLCPLLSHSSHMRSMRSPPPLLSLADVQDGKRPKDLAQTDAIEDEPLDSVISDTTRMV